MQESVSVLQVVLKHISAVGIVFSDIFWLCATYGDTLIPT